MNLRTLRRAPGFWAMCDQAIVSVGTFAFTLILARSLSVADLGVFAVFMGIVLAGITVHTSLIGIPLMVLLGRSTHPRQLSAVALGLAALTTPVFVGALAVAAFVLGRPGLLPAVALALAGAEVQETFRRSLMGRLDYRRAAAGDAVSYLGQAVAVGFLAATGTTTLGAAFTVMGLSSIAGAVVQLVQVRPTFRRDAFRRDTILPFWRLGGALVAVNGIGALTAQVFVWLLAGYHGVVAAGSYQALLTVVSPANPLMTAANSIITTRAAHITAPDPALQHDLENRVARRYGRLFAVPFLVYCMVLLAAPEFALRLFFGASSLYLGLQNDLRIFVLFACAQYAYFVTAGVLNARQDVRSLLGAQVGAGLVLGVAVPIIAVGSLGWTFVAITLSAAVRAGVAVGGAVRRRPQMSQPAGN